MQDLTPAFGSRHDASPVGSSVGRRSRASGTCGAGASYCPLGQEEPLRDLAVRQPRGWSWATRSSPVVRSRGPSRVRQQLLCGACRRLRVRSEPSATTSTSSPTRRQDRAHPARDRLPADRPGSPRGFTVSTASRPPRPHHCQGDLHETLAGVKADSDADLDVQASLLGILGGLLTGLGAALNARYGAATGVSLGAMAWRSTDCRACSEARRFRR